MCPEGVEGMRGLEMSRLSGDWFMQRSLNYARNYVPTACFHIKTEVNEDGTFNAIEEARFAGKDWVAQNIKGEITDDLIKADLFDNDLSVRMQILDTDYDNYSVSLECFDN